MADELPAKSKIATIAGPNRHGKEGVTIELVKEIMGLPAETPDGHLVNNEDWLMAYAVYLRVRSSEQSPPASSSSSTGPKRSDIERARADEAAASEGPASPPSRGRKRRQDDEMVPAQPQATEADERILIWLRQVIDLDRQIYTGKHEDGNPYRPHWEADGTNIRYPDPFADLLKGRFRDGVVPDITMDITLYRKCRDAGEHLRWRSTELLNAVVDGLSQLWLAPEECKVCGKTLTNRLGHDFAKAVLAGRISVPGGKFRGLRLKDSYPQHHPWCLQLAERVVLLEAELQDMLDDDPETIALRQKKWVELLSAVKTAFKEEGLTTADLRDSLYGILGKGGN